MGVYIAMVEVSVIVWCVFFLHTVRIVRTPSRDKVPHETSMLVQHGKGKDSVYRRESCQVSCNQCLYICMCTHQMLV